MKESLSVKNLRAAVRAAFGSTGPVHPPLALALGLSVIACEAQTIEPITMGSSWCTKESSAQTQYCRDFDDGRPYDAGWSSTYSTPEELASLDAADAPLGSAPTSLLFATPELAAGVIAIHQLKQLGSSESGVALESALKITSFDARLADLTLVTIYARGSDEWFLGLDRVGDSIQLTDAQPAADGGPTMQVHHRAPLPPLGAMSMPWAPCKWPRTT